MRLSRRGVLAGGVSLTVGLEPRKPRAAEEPAIGTLVLTDPPKAMPVLRFTDGAGGAHGLAEFAGQGVVLNFWATWCGPCVAEMPSLAKLAAAVRGDGIVVIPVASDAGGAAAVAGFFRAHGIAGLGIWLDAPGAGLSAVGGLGLPTTLIVDRRRREVARIAGAADWGVESTARTVRVLCQV